MYCHHVTKTVSYDLPALMVYIRATMLSFKIFPFLTVHKRFRLPWHTLTTLAINGFIGTTNQLLAGQTTILANQLVWLAGWLHLDWISYNSYSKHGLIKTHKYYITLLFQMWPLMLFKSWLSDTSVAAHFTCSYLQARKDMMKASHGSTDRLTGACGERGVFVSVFNRYVSQVMSSMDQ